MEMKAVIICTLLLFPLLFTPCICRGKLDAKTMDSEINFIDYRGPETHTHNPPPNKSRNHPKIQRQSTVAGGKSKGQIYKAKKTVRSSSPSSFSCYIYWNGYYC
ncbi:uncharacterized protein LOC111391767 isoform X1 [Olea europaea var. sylvestris]|uniref:uncharacterized protein LOC111391767 isoform X1 n=1 Tax=Olea europaea var. sylvestris TaxID=158386 RepID=UPI000C1D6102|nr:uncharacterized protein LOC111391767 isoform X1 [Olea europaea var. sylvestris]